jgi:hypothetical protein
MRIVHHVVAVALATAGLTACSSTPTTRQLAQDVVTAMGGTEKLQSILTLVMKDGTGTRMRLGQTVRVGDQEMPAQLTKVVEIADLANGRASLDYELRSGEFTQHRHEILTKLGEGAGASRSASKSSAPSRLRPPSGPSAGNAEFTRVPPSTQCSQHRAGRPRPAPKRRRRTRTSMARC